MHLGVTFMDVTGKKWVLVDMVYEGEGFDIPEGAEVTLKIGDTRLAGSTGCNRYFASYFDLGDGMVRIGAVGSTKSFCEGLMHLERTFFESMMKVTKMMMEGEDLVLCSLGDEVKLTFSLYRG